MKATIQARLDEETRAALDHLVRRYGFKPSEVIQFADYFRATTHNSNTIDACDQLILDADEQFFGNGVPPPPGRLMGL